MKILAAFATVLLATSRLMADNPTTAKMTDTKATEVKPVDKTLAPVGKNAAKKPAPELTIRGTVITRADGTFLGLEAVGGDFKLSFYDKKKKPLAPDASRATVRWPNQRGPGDLRAVLNPSGNSLVGGQKRVDPPYTYKVYLTLLQGEGSETKAGESFVVPFRG